jgi:uncharacterized protein
MRTSHRILLKLFHDPRYEFADVRVAYIDRGAPSDTSWVSGKEISRLDSQYIEIITKRGESCIPYHRILQILYRGEVMWDRTPTTEPKNEGEKDV